MARPTKEELDKVQYDILAYGASCMKDGKHIPLNEVRDLLMNEKIVKAMDDILTSPKRKWFDL